jgi:uncharacterized protein DUF1656
MGKQHRTMADTNRISIAETNARNAQAPRAVGASTVWRRQKPVAKHPSRSFILIGLIDRRNHRPLQPLLYQRATSVLAPSQLSSPIRTIFAAPKKTRDHVQGHRTPGQGRKKVPMRLTPFIPCLIAAVFPHADEATLEAVGKFDRWIHWGQPELNVAGLLIPWLMLVGALGFLAAWLVMAILERTGLSRHLWHLPLFFVALLVLFSSLIGTLFFP